MTKFLIIELLVYDQTRIEFTTEEKLTRDSSDVDGGEA